MIVFLSVYLFFSVVFFAFADYVAFEKGMELNSLLFIERGLDMELAGLLKRIEL